MTPATKPIAKSRGLELPVIQTAKAPAIDALAHDASIAFACVI
jgi:hypothetical protein